MSTQPVLSSSKLKDIRLGTQMADAPSITAYIEEKVQKSDISAGYGLTKDDNTLNVDKSIIATKCDEGCIAYGVGSQAHGLSTVAYTDYSMSEGKYTIAGTHSFRVVSGDIFEKTWTLKSVEGLEPGMWYTVRLLNNFDMVGQIVAVFEDSHKISVDEIPNGTNYPVRTSENLSDEFLKGTPFYMPEGNGLRAHPTSSSTEYYDIFPNPKPEYCSVDVDTDFNSLWIFRHPELGDLSSYATAAHAEGYMSIAGRQFSHAEGLCCVTQGKYAHAEGWQTAAVWSAHSEGNQTSAYGQSSHAEGQGTLTRGRASHASGRFACISGNYSFVWNGCNYKYWDHGDETFNINPLNGINGFYIGDKNLVDYGQEGILTPKINSAVARLDETVKEIISEGFQTNVPVEMISKTYASPGIWIRYTDNKIMDPSLSSHYGMVMLNVTPGDELSVSTTLGYYSGVVARNLYGQMISSWHCDNHYVEYLSNDTWVVKGWSSLPEEIREQYPKEEIDKRSLSDDYHWLRLRYPFATYISSHNNATISNYVITIPEDCYTLNVSNLKMYNTDGSLDVNNATHVFHNGVRLSGNSGKPLSGYTWYLDETPPETIISCIAVALGAKVYETRTTDNQ